MNGGFAPIFVFAPVWIVLFSCSKFFSECNSGFIVNEVQRYSFRGLMWEKILWIWFKSSLILLGLSCISFLVAILLPITDTGANVMSLDNPISLFVFSNVNLVFYGTIIANIGLLINYRVKRMIVTVSLTQITFTLLAITLNMIGVRLDAVMGGYEFQNTLDIYNALTLSGGHSYFWSTIVIFSLSFVSTILVYYLYSNKEKTVMNFEK
jgi:hypothetical protein